MSKSCFKPESGPQGAQDQLMLRAPVRGGVPTNRVGRYDHIDALRAFSVILVALQHAGFRLVPGDSGVTIFFGISGFIITSLLIRERSSTGGFNTRRFYLRRLFKLAPPFLVAIALPTAVYACFKPVSFGLFLSQVFFSFNWVEIYISGAQDKVLPGTSPVWSLAVEEQFYIGFAVLWILLLRVERWRLKLAVITCMVIVASAVDRLFLSLHGADPIRILRGTDTRIEAIAWGVLLALMLSTEAWRWLRSDLVLGAGIVLYLGSLVFRHGWVQYSIQPSLQAIAGVLIIGYGMVPTASFIKRIFYRMVAWRPLQYIGLSSYSIYLVHYPIISGLRKDNGRSKLSGIQSLIFRHQYCCRLLDIQTGRGAGVCHSR